MIQYCSVDQLYHTSVKNWNVNPSPARFSHHPNRPKNILGVFLVLVFD